MVSTEAVQIAAALEPDDGWYKPGTEDVIADVAHDMLEAGMHSHLIEEQLGSIVTAMRAEYGE